MVEKNLVKEFLYEKSKIEDGSEIYRLEFNQKECNVCFTTWTRGSKVAEIGTCKHAFCAECLKHWIDTNPERGQVCMLCRKQIDPEAQPINLNRIEMANHQALQELNDEMNQIANFDGFNHGLEMVGPNHAVGNDPFEVGRRVQFELQRLEEDTVETTADEDQFQVQSIFSATMATEDTRDMPRVTSGNSESGLEDHSSEL